MDSVLDQRLRGRRFGSSWPRAVTLQLCASCSLHPGPGLTKTLHPLGCMVYIQNGYKRKRPQSETKRVIASKKSFGHQIFALQYMSTGYGWEGIRQVYVWRYLVRAMYLSTSAVAVSTWGAITSARPLPLPFYNLSTDLVTVNFALSYWKWIIRVKTWGK